MATLSYDQALELSRSGRLDLVSALTIAEQTRAAGSASGAARLYQTWLDGLPADSPYRALAHVAMFNLGVLLGTAGDHAGAERLYRQAIAHKADFAEAHINLGTQVEAQGRRAEAIAIWQQVLDRGLAAGPSQQALQVHLLNNLGRALEADKVYDRAEQVLERSLRLRPDQDDVLQHWVHLRQKQCTWPLLRPVPGVDPGRMMRATSPLAMLAAFDDPGLQLWRASAFVHQKMDLKRPPAVHHPDVTNRAATVAAGRRIRIGYLSSDFCQHAVSLLTVELLELHDRSRFEVFGFSWTRDDGSPLRARVKRAMDEYVPIGALTDDQAVEAIVARRIDVLVDLQGLTSGARPNILARRPAPVQVTYLGLPGTTGLPCIDYVIADRFVLPAELAPYFIEKPLYMPHCFQASDRQRTAAPLPSRAESGLPEDAVVFCSFNNNYKFTEQVFASWLRILRAVPGSVLWLLADNEWARASMLAAARAHGVAEARLIFAPRAHTALYLARYRLADLFLDAFPFNGGTTANDALWMGLPLLTCPGRTFASRMAGSLLHHLGLPELIAGDPADYERRAIALGHDRAGLTALRERLARAKVESPVFDMPRFTRDLESRLEALVLAPGS